ncbi:MAG: DUF3307 domain-containing protein [Nitrosomonas sp.]|nr:DUF3307 domain-containing protein [Nitrosomonas sp.]
MTLLIKLLIVHLIVDFTLQWRTMLADKQNLRFRSPYLYLHGLLHGLLTLAILADLNYFYGALIIFVSHTIIDGLKLTLQTKNNERLLFFVDQLLHIAILVGIAHYYQPIAFLSITEHDYFYPHLLFIIYLTFPASIVIQKIFLKWDLSDIAASASLVGAGAYIGIIERFIIYGAVVTLNWNIIGFLLAAKSIFRFGDMRDAHDRKYTEYIFVGTLLSFVSAILCGVLFMLYTGQSLTSQP